MRALVLVAGVVLGLGACSSSGHHGTAKTSTSTSPTTPTTGADQLPSPFTEGQNTGLPGDLEMRVASATRAGGQIHVAVEITNGRSGPLSLGDLKPLFTFRATFFGADTPLLSSTGGATPIAAAGTATLQLVFTDPGAATTKQATLYFHGQLVGSDKATFALLSLVPK